MRIDQSFWASDKVISAHTRRKGTNLPLQLVTSMLHTVSRWSGPKSLKRRGDCSATVAGEWPPKSLAERKELTTRPICESDHARVQLVQRTWVSSIISPGTDPGSANESVPSLPSKFAQPLKAVRTQQAGLKMVECRKPFWARVLRTNFLTLAPLMKHNLVGVASGAR